MIAAETLRGRSIRLPDGLAGERNLLVIAYERDQQADVDTWLVALGNLELAPPEFSYYELPTIGGGMRFMRPVIDAGMRRGIRDRQQRDRVITLFLDKDWFRGQVGTAHTDDIAALLVDREGWILHRWFGACDERKGAELREVLVGGKSPDQPSSESR
ncbi:MAG: hypothetical protein R6X25_12480 [Candidatus Krumholzibacteriia bacterium]